MPTSEAEAKRIEWLAEHPGEPFPDDESEAPEQEQDPE
jgi:hypothetical protein